MGNSVWGAGYHQGSTDGYRSGFGQGAGVGAAATAFVGLLLAGATFGYEELKKRRVAKHEQSLLAEGELSGSGEEGDSEDDRNK